MSLLQAALLLVAQSPSPQGDVPYQLPDPIQGAPLVVGAYALFWAVAVAFLIVLYRRQSRLELELKTLADQLARRSASAPARSGVER